MKNTEEFLRAVAKERPVGTVANREVLDTIREEALQRGYDFITLPFDCKVWEKGASTMSAGDTECDVFPSPFSKPFSGSGRITAVSSAEELASADLKDSIVFLRGDLSKEPLMPKDFPFYYPDEHRKLIDLLEEKQPKAVVAVTGKHPLCGLEPYPMFEDGNFGIPSAYADEAAARKTLEQYSEVRLSIISAVNEAKSSQLIITKRSSAAAKGRIVLCAHMDTKYGTTGAIDNATGVAVLVAAMDRLKSYAGEYDIEFVPFNGEEYYEVKGELLYSEYLQKGTLPVILALNIDGSCHKGSHTAVSSYNLATASAQLLSEEMAKYEDIVQGPQWYAGDHSMFVYGGIPCLALTSSDLYGGVLDLTHTDKDTIEQVSCELIEKTANFIAGLIEAFA